MYATVLPSALAASEVSSPGRLGTASGRSPVTAPCADSVSEYSRVGAYGEVERAAATTNFVASWVAATSPQVAPCHGGARVLSTRPVAADSTCSFDSRLLSLTVSTTWNGG